jgi:hypothetical protein
MPGFMQFITGVYLLIGLTWFNVFGNVAPLYMAGVAFTAYGIHWFAMAQRRYIDSSAQPDGAQRRLGVCKVLCLTQAEGSLYCISPTTPIKAKKCEQVVEKLLCESKACRRFSAISEFCPRGVPGPLW